MGKTQKQPPNIFTEQNSAHNQVLLAAQRQLYKEAKIIRRWRTVVSVGLAIIAPFLLLLFSATNPNLDITLAAVGAFWLAIERLVLKNFEDNKIKQAATVQEEFDTSLFALPWNEVLVGNRVTPETVTPAANRYQGDKAKFLNWYPDTGKVPYPLNVLMCQRTNFVWDSQLRRHFANGLTVATVVYIVLLLIFAIAAGQLVWDFLLGLVVPSLAVTVEGFDSAKDHRRIANDKEETAAKIQNMWNERLKDLKKLTTVQCRSVQDCLYNSRNQSALVPEWIFNLLRNRYEKDMHDSAAALRAQVEDALRN
jgi:hypothetical protein